MITFGGWLGMGCQKGSRTATTGQGLLTSAPKGALVGSTERCRAPVLVPYAPKGAFLFL